MKRNKVYIEGNDNFVAIDSSIICIPTNPKIEIERKQMKVQNLFAEKMIEVFDMMNKYLPYEKQINIEVLSKLLGLESVFHIEQYFCTPNEPSFEFLETISEKLGLASDWLKYSQGSPFATKTIHSFYYQDIIDELMKEEITDIYMIISDEVDARIMIYTATSLYHYRRFSKVYPFHQNVGATGQSEIYDFYKLAKRINETDCLYDKTNTFVLKPGIFDAVLLGKYFPGCVRKENLRTSYFWEDLLDLNYQYFKEQQYEQWYGIQFPMIQKIILNKKEREKEYE